MVDIPNKMGSQTSARPLPVYRVMFYFTKSIQMALYILHVQLLGRLWNIQRIQFWISLFFDQTNSDLSIPSSPGMLLSILGPGQNHSKAVSSFMSCFIDFNPCSNQYKSTMFKKCDLKTNDVFDLKL